MLWIGDKKAGKIYIGNKAVASLYRGAVKIYESIRSCYGSGRWRYGKMYRYGDKWRYSKQ